TRSDKFDSKDGIVATYIHPPGRMGALVEIGGVNADLASHVEFKQFARYVAMHVAASDPLCVSREQVPAETLEAEKEIYRNQGLNEGKPAEIVEKMIQGRINKYYGEVCMLEQPWVVDDSIKTRDAIKQASEKFGGANLEIRRFVRYTVGGS